MSESGVRLAAAQLTLLPDNLGRIRFTIRHVTMNTTGNEYVNDLNVRRLLWLLNRKLGLITTMNIGPNTVNIKLKLIHHRELPRGNVRPRAKQRNGNNNTQVNAPNNVRRGINMLSNNLPQFSNTRVSPPNLNVTVVRI